MPPPARGGRNGFAAGAGLGCPRVLSPAVAFPTGVPFPAEPWAGPGAPGDGWLAGAGAKNASDFTSAAPAGDSDAPDSNSSAPADESVAPADELESGADELESGDSTLESGVDDLESGDSTMESGASDPTPGASGREKGAFLVKNHGFCPDLAASGLFGGESAVRNGAAPIAAPGFGRGGVRPVCQ